jgi:hypothetical protein
MQSNKNPTIYSGFFRSRPKRKAEGYHDVFVQVVALSCGLSAKQMATSKQCKVPIKEDQRLDHATTLVAFLLRQLRFHLR